MYNRLSNEDIFRINQKVKTDRLFQNLYHALSSVGIDCKDITPEEIWEIASNELTIIAASEVKIFDVNTLHNKLRLFFAEYKNEDGIIYNRTQEDATRTAFLVELVILYRMVRCQKEWENHPYVEYCIILYKHISPHHLFEKLLEIIEETNDQYEAIYKSELPEHDDMPTIVKEFSIIKEAITLTLQCAKYLNPKYNEQWIIDFWNALLKKHTDILTKDLTGGSKETVIYGIIGRLKTEEVFNANQTELANCSSQENKDTLRKYVSKGARKEIDTNYDNFVNQYMGTNK